MVHLDDISSHCRTWCNGYSSRDIDPSKARSPGFMILIRINAAEDRAKSDTLGVHSKPFITEAGSEIPISIKPRWIHSSLVAI